MLLQYQDSLCLEGNPIQIIVLSKHCIYSELLHGKPSGSDEEQPTSMCDRISIQSGGAECAPERVIFEINISFLIFRKMGLLFRKYA